MATPLEVCEQRDRKGLYAKARAGLVQGFTGIGESYEVPEKPEILVDTREESAEAATERIVAYLVEKVVFDLRRGSKRTTLRPEEPIRPPDAGARRSAKLVGTSSTLAFANTAATTLRRSRCLFDLLDRLAVGPQPVELLLAVALLGGDPFGFGP